MRRRRGEPGAFGGATDRTEVAEVAAAKSALRRELRARREALPAADVAAWSAAIGERVRAHPAVVQATTVHTFVGALAGEVATRPLIEALLASGKRVVCPRVAGETMAHKQLDVLSELEQSGLGLWEPPASAADVEPASIDAVLVPGLAFDRRGGRLGLGRGYYDGFLRGLAAVSIGLCFEAQRVDRVPMGPADVRVRWVVTEAGSFECGGSS